MNCDDITESDLDLQQKKQLTKNQKHKLRKKLSWRKKVLQTHLKNCFLFRDSRWPKYSRRNYDVSACRGLFRS